MTLTEQLNQARLALAATYKAAAANADSTLAGIAATAQKEVEALRAQVSGLETQLKETATNTGPRALFGVREGFNAGRDLKPVALEAYKGLWEWIDSMWASDISRMIAGLNPGNREPYEDGVIDIVNMRLMQHFTHALLVVLERTGDPKAADLLERAWLGVTAPERMAVKFYPDAQAKQLRFEQPNVPRWLHSQYRVDHDPLEFSLVSGPIAQAKLAFKQSGRLAGYARMAVVSANYEARLRFVARLAYSNLPWYSYYKPFRHALESAFNYHYFEWLDSGREDHKQAWEYLGQALQADNSYIDVEGKECLNIPHFNSIVRKLQTGAATETAAQDTTYLRESVPHQLLAHQAGSPYHSAKFIAAMARAVHMLVLYQGPKSEQIAATIAGVGVASDQGKNVVAYRGKNYPARWKQDRPTVTEDTLQVSRGMGTVGSAWAKDCPEFLSNLEALDTQTDSTEHKRWGSRAGMFLYALPTRLG